MENINLIISEISYYSNTYDSKRGYNILHDKKNMLGIIILYCDLKTIFNLLKVNKKFRELIKNEKIVPIFSNFIEAIGHHMTTKEIFDPNRTYLNKLGNKLLVNKEFNSYSQICHLLTEVLRFWIKRLFQSVGHTLNLSDSDVGENYETLKIFSEELADNTTIKRLILINNSLGFYPECMQIFCDALKKNKNILYLNLQKNLIGSYAGSMEFLSELIQENNTIKKFKLSKNSIGSNFEGMKVFSQKLKENKTITKLDLSHNSIGKYKANIIVFSEAFNRNNSILELNLQYNSIENDSKQLINQTRRNFIIEF